MPDVGQACSVQGRVKTPAGHAARDLAVVAYARHLRSRRELGRSLTNRSGDYTIHYGLDGFESAERGGADLVIEVASSGGEVLYSSDTVFNAASHLDFDIQLTARASEADYDQIVRLVQPLIDGHNIQLRELEENDRFNDIGFLAGETRIARDRLIGFAIAQRLATDRLPAQFWFALLRAGVVSEPMPPASGWPSLQVAAEVALARALAISPRAVEAGLRNALSRNVLGAGLEHEISNWVAGFRDVQLTPVNPSSGPAAASTPASVAFVAEPSTPPAVQMQRILHLTGVHKDQHLPLVEAFIEHRDRDKLIEHIRDENMLDSAQLAALETYLKVHEIVLDDSGIVAAVNEFGIDPKHPHAARDMARASADDWLRVIGKANLDVPDFVAGDTPEQKRVNYAKHVESLFQRSFPTAAFAAQLARGQDSKGVASLSHSADLLRFLNNNPDFDLASTRIDRFLKQATHPDAVTLASTKPFVQQLKLTQRVFKLAPNFKAADALIADGLHSAQQVNSLGKAAFVQAFADKPGFTKETAAMTFERAANTYAAAVAISGQLRAINLAQSVFALNNRSGAGNVPDLASLFGSIDSCECEECSSVFGASAYLADVLMYLKNRKAADQSATVRSILLDRRPDIADIQLDCSNTNTTLPYIDLVCEVLEDRVAPWCVLPGTVAGSLVTGPVQDSLRAALLAGKPQITLSPSALILDADPLGRRLLRDGNREWRIRPANGAFEVSVLRQTTGTTEELAANPEYVSEAAYGKLALQKYPASLPFDLPSEEVRAYLAKIGVDRSDVMNAFRGPPQPALDSDVAAEYLGISPGSVRIIFSSDAANQFQYWGEPDNASAIADIANVEVFLGKTGLTYEDLQTLLTLGFINPDPAHPISIVPHDASCDLSAKKIQPLNETILDGIHRFLRLWRQLGWQMWEVDITIRNAKIGNGNIDGNFLLNLAAFVRIRNKLGQLSVEKACALFDRLNTRANFTAASGRPQAPLYSQLFLDKQVMAKDDLAAFAVSVVTKADSSPANAPDIAPRYVDAVASAIRTSSSELQALLDLSRPASGGASQNYIDGKLNLGNLSFLYRHNLLIKILGIKAADWAKLLRILQIDVFASPASLLALLNLNERIVTTGYSINELSYLLSADLTARSAETDTHISSLLTAVRASLQKISASNSAPLPADTDGLISVIVARLQILGWNQTSINALSAQLGSQVHVATIPVDFVFPPAITATGAVPIAFAADSGPRPDPTLGGMITFRGLMTAQQKSLLLSDVSLGAVTGLPDYVGAINGIYSASHAAMKLYWPEFRASLKVLPPEARFPASLAGKVSYDADRLELVFFGTMTASEKADLEHLSTDPHYIAAVDMLFTNSAGDLPGQHWVEAADDLAAAVGNLVAYTARQSSNTIVVQALSQVLGLSAAVTDYLLTKCKLFNPVMSMLDSLLDPVFVQSSSAISSTSFPNLFNGYRGLHRISIILNKSNPALADLDFVVKTSAQTGAIDFSTLPLSYDAVNARAISIDSLLDLTRLLELQRAFASPNLSLFDVLNRVITDSGYTNGMFASDVSLFSGWPQADLATLTSPNGLNVAYPVGYRRVAAWDGLVKCFDLTARMNGSAAGAISLAARDMTANLAQMAKQQLRAKFEPEQWRDISKSVQDGLRQLKRDSLVAYLLTQPMPDGAPTGKWDNSEDLYSCFLIDVEMGSCMQTSRIVQATNSVQLFVQRCFMGLEPKVRVSVDADETWKQWIWMKNYREWEANRRVFVYPENYAEPELRRDKSGLFQKLEDDLLQSDMTKDSVDTAFENYLNKLDEVAQLEISGTYYQENTHTLHVFGRTPGSEPHVYYYRQFINTREPGRWTPWAKVECDIKSDYLVPLVANERLHLVWSEFREQPDDQGTQKFPTSTDTTLPTTKTKTDLYLAVTEFRSGKWLPKKVSQQPISVVKDPKDPKPFDNRTYLIVPLDLTAVKNGPFQAGPFLLMVGPYSDNMLANPQRFELAGCKGYPELFAGDLPRIRPQITWFDGAEFSYMKSVEQVAGDGHPVVPKGNLFLSQLQRPELLHRTPERFKISFPQYMSRLDRTRLEAAPGAADYTVTLGAGYDWFYADKLRTFFVHNVPQKPSDPPGSGTVDVKLEFRNFYHPLTCYFIRQLNSPKGIDGLMSRETQFKDNRFEFVKDYAPEGVIIPPTASPLEVVEFKPGESYSQYNWELFFFAPLMIAERLSSNQKFADAQRWYHYIFDPTGGHDQNPSAGLPPMQPSQKYWITKPFFLNMGPDYDSQRIENLLSMLADHPMGETPPPLVQELWDHIQEWRDNPFDPHIVAQYRIVAYQKLVVMKYLDNLIAWGDQQFRQFTMESVRTATQLYILAAEILGPRPRKIRPAVEPRAETFNEMEARLDAFSDAHAVIELENLIPVAPADGTGAAHGATVPAPLYFCVPPNDKLLGYWDTVADRLYKIRHCLDLDGVPRTLALFAPPIDPALLIRALAGGASLGDALAGLDAPLPNYRFAVMLQAANEVVNDLKALGSSLLSALEKKDAEQLVRLRQQQELTVLNTTRAIKQAQIDVIRQSLAGLQKSKEMVTVRRDYYASRPFMNSQEQSAISLNTASLIVHTAGTVADVLGGVMAVVPNFQMGAAGFGGSPLATVETGGSGFSKTAELAARALYQVSAILDKSAAITSILGGYQRRMDDWQFQVNVANKELDQMDSQIAGMQIQLENAQRELDSHDLAIRNSKAIDSFFHDKYTNKELYQWMVTQISQTFWTTYQLAFDLAKRAERCFQYERGVEQSSFIKYGYWDSLRSGLGAGENLQLALRQLENAYREANQREYECTKHISMAVLNPIALLQLKDTGTCMVDIPEEVFDLDYPGHYFRRIKSVSLSLPCVAGPYATVNCTLRLIKSMVRTKADVSPQYEHNNDGGVFKDDPRFRESRVRVNAIATSNAQNDSGMFELNFRDERYLPFEGGGAISTWQIELMADRNLRQFDYDTLSDVILHMHYTAREDAGAFKSSAIAHLRKVLKEGGSGMKLRQMFDLRREFGTEWSAFLDPSAPGPQTLKIVLGNEYFGMLAQDAKIDVTAVSLVAQTSTHDELKVQIIPLLGTDQQAPLTLPARPANDSGFRTVTKRLSTATELVANWSIAMSRTSHPNQKLTAEEFEECFLVIEYTLGDRLPG